MAKRKKKKRRSLGEAMMVGMMMGVIAWAIESSLNGPNPILDERWGKPRRKKKRPTERRP